MSTENSREWGDESTIDELTQDFLRMSAELAILRAEVATLRAEVAASRAERRGGDSKPKELKEPISKPSQKKDSKPKEQMESISPEKNLKSLLEARAPSSIILSNLSREYKVAFGDSHPLMKPENEKLGKYLERFEFISFDTSEQTDGTGKVKLSLKTTSD